MHASQGGAGGSNRWRRGEGWSGVAPAHFRFIILCCFLLRRTYFSQGKFAPLLPFPSLIFRGLLMEVSAPQGRGKGEWGIEEQQKRKVGGSERLSVYYIRCTKTAIGT